MRDAAFPRWDVVRCLAARVPWPHPEGAALGFVRDDVRVRLPPEVRELTAEVWRARRG